MSSDEIKRRIYRAIDGKHTQSRGERVFVAAISALIVLNVIAVILETEVEFYAKHRRTFELFDAFSVYVFTVEYLLRVATCTWKPEYRGALVGRLKFMGNPLSVVDLLAILPFWLPLLIPFDLRILRLFRIARFLRVLKLGRYSDSLHTLRAVIRSRRSDLGVALSALALLLLVSSSLMYYVEHEAQPKVFSSIPASMWWGVITVSTVGYGDVYPVTALGKFLAALCSATIRTAG